MQIKRTVKLISLLIIVFIVFQLIPSNIACTDGFQSHAQSSKMLLSERLFHTDNVYFNRENQKTQIHKVPIKNITINVQQLCIDDISLLNYSYHEEQFDLRKVIRQSIPHYFNGSKYRNNRSGI